MGMIFRDMSKDYYLFQSETMLTDLNKLIFNKRAYFDINNIDGEWDVNVNFKYKLREKDFPIRNLTYHGNDAFYLMCKHLQALQSDILECLEYIKPNEELGYNVWGLFLRVGSRDNHLSGNGISEQTKNALEWLKERGK